LALLTGRIRDLPARIDAEHTKKTVTYVRGLKCYQRARLQSVEPQDAARQAFTLSTPVEN